MYAPTANGASGARLLRTRPNTTSSKPNVATTSPSHKPAPLRTWVEMLTAGKPNIRFAITAPDDAAHHLRDRRTRRARRRRRPPNTASTPLTIGFRCAARDRADGENDRHQRRARGDRIFEQREPDIVRAERLRGDARADDRDHQQRGADELGERFSPQVLSSYRNLHFGATAAIRLRAAHVLEHAVASISTPAPSASAVRRARRHGAVVHPVAAPLAVDQPRVEQDAQVVADCRLGESEVIGHVTDARLSTRLGLQQAEDSKPSGVGERAQQGGQACRGLLVERSAREQRRAVQYWQRNTGGSSFQNFRRL